MSHVTHMHESCDTYQRVMSQIWMRHVTPMNESGHTYDMSHVINVTHTPQRLPERAHTREGTRHVSLIIVSRIIISLVIVFNHSLSLLSLSLVIECSHTLSLLSLIIVSLSIISLVIVCSHSLSFLSLIIRPTQSVMYVPLQVIRSQKCILLIVQYKHTKSCSGDFCSPESDPPHKIMRYWVYYSTQLCFWFPPDRIC